MRIHQNGKYDLLLIRREDTRKKWFRCLRCGRRMWTDRCHRLCRRCADTVGPTFDRLRVRVDPEDLPITLVEIGCYKLSFTDVQHVGEMRLKEETEELCDEEPALV